MRKLGAMSASKIAGVAAVFSVVFATSLTLLVPLSSGPISSEQGSHCVVPRGSGPGFDASISNRRGGSSFCIVIGERLLVVLSAGSPDAAPWRNIVVSKPGILQVAPLTLMFSRGVTGMNFRAVRLGTVVLSAQRPACSPVTPGEPICGAIELWRATITVRQISGSPSKPTRSGVFGVVTAGPTCPLERIGHPCLARPVAGSVDVRSATGGFVATARTNAMGRYSVSVDPGNYSLTVVTGSVFPRCPGRVVAVPAGSPVRANISCDTGIR